MKYLLVIAFASVSGASTRLGPVPEQRLELPFMSLRGFAAHDVCVADTVFIGTILQVDAYWLPAPPSLERNEIYSRLGFQVEHTLRGELGDLHEVWTPEGELDGFRTTVSIPFPKPQLGRRYLMALWTVTPTPAGWPFGMQGLASAIPIMRNDGLGSTKEMLEAIYEQCPLPVRLP